MKSWHHEWEKRKLILTVWEIVAVTPSFELEPSEFAKIVRVERLLWGPNCKNRYPFPTILMGTPDFSLFDWHLMGLTPTLKESCGFSLMKFLWIWRLKEGLNGNLVTTAMAVAMVAEDGSENFSLRVTNYENLVGFCWHFFLVFAGL